MNILKKILFEALTLYILTIWISGLRVAGGLTTFLLAGMVLTVASFVVKPIINFITTPFAALSFGLSRILDNAFILFILTKIVPQIRIVSFYFPRVEYFGFVIPKLVFGYFLAFIVIACAKTLLQVILRWIVDR